MGWTLCGLGVRGEGSWGDIWWRGEAMGDVGGCCIRGDGEGTPIGEDGGGIGERGGPQAMPPPEVDTVTACW